MTPEDGSDAAATLLVGISNPETADRLVRLSATLTRSRPLDILLTHVVTVANQIGLATGQSSPEVISGRDLLEETSAAARAAGIDVRALVEVARSVEDGLLAAADSHHAEMILVGYTGEAEEEEERFDKAMQRVARKASADVIVAKFRGTEQDRILVPLASDVPLRLTGLLCRALAEDGGAAVTFLHVVESGGAEDEARRELEKALERSGLAALGPLRVLTSDDPVATIVDEARHHGLVILGPSARPGLLDAVFSSRARKIAESVPSSVILAWGPR